MKKALSSFELSCVMEEMKPLQKGIIDSISMPDKKEVYLGIHIAGQGKTYVRIIAGKVMHLAKTKKLVEKASGFCQFLRKYLDQARIKKIEQVPWERVVTFHCDAKEGDLVLVFELYSKGNILLIKDNVILGCADNQEWKDRSVKSGQNYAISEKPKFSGELLEEVLKKSKSESLVKMLAMECGFGGVYAEELCKRAELDKNSIPKNVTSEDIKKIILAWNKLQKEKIMGYCIYMDKVIIDVTPFALVYYEGLDAKKFPTYSEALEFAWHQEEEAPELANVRKKIEKLSVIIQEQEKNIARWEKEVEEAQKSGEYIYYNYLPVKDLLEKSKDAFGKNIPMPKEVKEVKRKEKKVIVEI